MYPHVLPTKQIILGIVINVSLSVLFFLFLGYGLIFLWEFPAAIHPHKKIIWQAWCCHSFPQCHNLPCRGFLGRGQVVTMPTDLLLIFSIYHTVTASVLEVPPFNLKSLLL